MTSVSYDFREWLQQTQLRPPQCTLLWVERAGVSTEPRYVSSCLPLLIFLQPFRMLSQLFESFILCTLVLLARLLTCLFTVVSTTRGVTLFILLVLVTGHCFLKSTYFLVCNIILLGKCLRVSAAEIKSP